MSFLGLFLECDYSHYVFFADTATRKIDIHLYGKFKREVSDYKIYLEWLTQFNRKGMGTDICVCIQKKPSESVEIYLKKHRFRQFLTEKFWLYN